jgi:hypothetical protein
MTCRRIEQNRAHEIPFRSRAEHCHYFMVNNVNEIA